MSRARMDLHPESIAPAEVGCNYCGWSRTLDDGEDPLAAFKAHLEQEHRKQ